MEVVGQDVCPRQHPGVVVYAQQIQDGGQHIHVAAGGVAHHRRVQPAAPHDAGGAIVLKVLFRQLAQDGPGGFVGEVIGVMVAGEDDQGAVELACLLQPLQEILHGALQLQIAGQVAAGVGCELVAVDRLGDVLEIPVADVVVFQVVGPVAAEGHVVDVEPVQADVVVHGLLHHLQVGGRPQIGEPHVPPEFAGVSKVGVGPVPAVVGAVIVVIGEAVHPDQAEKVARPVGHVGDHDVGVDVGIVVGLGKAPELGGHLAVSILEQLTVCRRIGWSVERRFHVGKMHRVPDGLCTCRHERYNHGRGYYYKPFHRQRPDVTEWLLSPCSSE